MHWDDDRDGQYPPAVFHGVSPVYPSASGAAAFWRYPGISAKYMKTPHERRGHFPDRLSRPAARHRQRAQPPPETGWSSPPLLHHVLISDFFGFVAKGSTFAMLRIMFLFLTRRTSSCYVLRLPQANQHLRTRLCDIPDIPGPGIMCTLQISDFCHQLLREDLTSRPPHQTQPPDALP